MVEQLELRWRAALEQINHPLSLRREIRKTAQDFEAFFLGQMLQPMFQNLGAEAPFGGGHGEEVWRSMQVQEYGKAITEAGGIGIADSVLREMIKMQELQ